MKAPGKTNSDKDRMQPITPSAQEEEKWPSIKGIIIFVIIVCTVCCLASIPIMCFVEGCQICVDLSCLK